MRCLIYETPVQPCYNNKKKQNRTISIMRIEGYDYAIRPIILILGDTKFVELLNQGFLALGYGTIPEFGLLVNAPCLTMMFETDDIATECFRHFLSWKGDSNDADALQISFVEFEDGGYGMCSSQNIDRLIERMIPELYRKEIEPRIMTVGHLKSFPQISEGYLWFKSNVESSPFVIVPASKQFPPNPNLAIYKREINFYKEKELPEHSVEAPLVRNRHRTDEGLLSREIPSEIRFGGERFIERRWKQLKRFFPVTLERLGFNQNFTKIKTQLLTEGYREWQIIQAACNISLKNYAPELFVINNTISEEESEEKNNTPATKILKYILNNSENIYLPFPSEDKLSLENLREQINADSLELLSYFKESRELYIEPNNIQVELQKHQLLDK